MVAEQAPTQGTSTIRIRGKVVPTVEREVPHTSLRYSADNPRVYSLLRKGKEEPSQEEIEDQLQNMEHVRELVQDIRRNVGLLDPLFVKDVTWEVIEGNSRLAAWRLLAKQDPVKWDRVKCVLLPADIEKKLVSALLGQWHLKGKKEWPPYEQAGYLYRRNKEDGVAVPDLAHEVGLGTSRVKQAIEAYDFMLRHGEAERERYSYYYEYVRSSKIRRARKKFADLDRVVVEQIKSKSILRAQDLRDKLPVVCVRERALRSFARGELSLDDAYDRAVTAGGRHSPYQKLKKFRLWLADADVQSDLADADGSIGDQVKFELNKLRNLADRLHKRLSK